MASYNKKEWVGFKYFSKFGGNKNRKTSSQVSFKTFSEAFKSNCFAEHLLMAITLHAYMISVVSLYILRSRIVSRLQFQECNVVQKCSFA